MMSYCTWEKLHTICICQAANALTERACFTQQSFRIGQTQLDHWILQDGLKEWAVCVKAFVHVFWRGLPVSKQPLALQQGKRREVSLKKTVEFSLLNVTLGVYFALCLKIVQSY